MLNRATHGLRGAIQRLRSGGDTTADDLPTTGQRRLSQRVLHALGLHDQPFAPVARADELYVDDATRMQLNILSKQLLEGEVLPLLKGEAGSGKTAVLIRLMTEQASHIHFFVARGDASLDAHRITLDMLRMLVRPIPDDPQACYRELTRHLRGLTAGGQPAALVIDDADQLADRELQHLLTLRDSLERHLYGRFRLLLAGEPPLEGRLAALESEQLAGGHMIATDVRPLPRARLSGYLQHRLAAAGSAGFPFSDNDLDRIFQAAGGLPGAVEVAAAAVLEGRYGGPARS